MLTRRCSRMVMAAACVLTSAAASAQYTAVQLGSGVVATDINNRPQVVGFDASTRELLLWDVAGRHGLGVRIEPSVAPRINDNGVIVGVRSTDAGPRSFAVVNGSLYDLPAPPGDGVHHVSALTNVNTLLVQGQRGSWLFHDGIWTNLTDVTGADIRAINEAGTIGGGTTVGELYSSPYLRYADGRVVVPWNDALNGRPQGTVIRPQPPIMLLGAGGHFASAGAGTGAVPYWWSGTPDGSVTRIADASVLLREYQPLDINAAGDVVGYGQGRRMSPLEPWYSLGFVRRNGTTTWLPLDRGVAINDAGLIVGSVAASAVVLVPASSLPSGVVFAVRDRVVTLVWQPATGAIEYFVEAGSTSGARDLYHASAGAQPMLVTPAPPGRYYVRVRARTLAGLTPPSEEVVIDVP